MTDAQRMTNPLSGRPAAAAERGRLFGPAPVAPPGSADSSYPSSVIALRGAD